MTKMTLTKSLVLAGVLAAAGVAQAQLTYDVPQQAGEMSTMTQGAPNLSANNIPNEGPDTTILGAGPAVVTTYSYVTTPSYVYVTPSAPVVNYELWNVPRGNASETSNVPERAGEASTMTGGAPNALANNDTFEYWRY